MESSRSYYQEFMQVYKERGLASAMIYDLERTVGVSIADSITASAVEGINFTKSVTSIPWMVYYIRGKLKERKNQKVANEILL